MQLFSYREIIVLQHHDMVHDISEGRLKNIQKNITVVVSV